MPRLLGEPGATREFVPVSVKKTLLLREPWPGDPAAETAMQPRIWCVFKADLFQPVFLSGGMFSSQTPVRPVRLLRVWIPEGLTQANS